MILLCALFFKLLVLTAAYPNPQQDLDIIEDEIFADKHYIIEPTENCDAFVEPDSVAIENTKNCTEFAVDGYRCVPFYGCTNGEIITNGKNVLDIRSFSLALDPQTSICPGDLEVCCRHPDWRDVPLTTQVVIKHPPPECKSGLGGSSDDYSCLQNETVYQDLEDIPSNDSCNECYCDFGEVICSADSCGSEENYENKTEDATELAQKSVSSCTQDGIEYEHLFPVQTDKDCTSCQCFDGEVLCTSLKSCDAVNKNIQQKFAGCTYAGGVYKHLDNFSDDCNACTCFNGAISCTEKICGNARTDIIPDPDDKDATLLQGEPTGEPTKKATAVCGLRNIDGIGPKMLYEDGPIRKAQFGEWPHMCTILRDIKIGGKVYWAYSSGASLIAPNVILTAAHNVFNMTDPSKIKVRCGDWDQKDDDIEIIKHQDVAVKEIMFHPGFRNHYNYHDVAVVVMKENFNLDRHINTICMPNQKEISEFISFDNCFATGWGKDKFGTKGQYQSILKHLKMNMVEHDSCEAKLRNTRLGESFGLDYSFNCAGGEAGIDLCTGDGGGPLVCASKSNPNSYYQIGISSWGIGCGEEDVPGVYADVSKSMCFIDYATKCMLGQDTNYYGISGCKHWAEETYCNIEKELEKVQDKISNNPKTVNIATYIEAENIKRYLRKLERTFLKCEPPSPNGIRRTSINCFNPRGVLIEKPRN